MAYAYIRLEDDQLERLADLVVERLDRASSRAGPFSPLLDAKAAGGLLAVPHTWLLAQAREGRIPHHRLGHYVRFNADDLVTWLRSTRQGPPVDSHQGSCGA